MPGFFAAIFRAGCAVLLDGVVMVLAAAFFMGVAFPAAVLEASVLEAALFAVAWFWAGPLLVAAGPVAAAFFTFDDAAGAGCPAAFDERLREATATRSGAAAGVAPGEANKGDAVTVAAGIPSAASETARTRASRPNRMTAIPPTAAQAIDMYTTVMESCTNPAINSTRPASTSATATNSNTESPSRTHSKRLAS
jgi:hypothetical protein